MRSARSMQFIAANLPSGRLAAGGMEVLELGSCNPWGGYRDLVGLCGPGNRYTGVDIVDGPGVDVVSGVEEIVRRLGSERFDLVIGTELLEHVEDWRGAITNIKNVCRPGGRIILTTRSRGFGYHGVPNDYWRFEVPDVRRIFSDCEIIAVEEDPDQPGVFAAVDRPADFEENDLSDFELFSIVSGRRVREIAAGDYRSPRFLINVLTAKARFMMCWLFSYEKKDIPAKARRQVGEARSLLSAYMARRSRDRQGDR